MGEVGKNQDIHQKTERLLRIIKSVKLKITNGGSRQEPGYSSKN